MNRFKFRLWDRKKEKYAPVDFRDRFIILPDGTVEFPLDGWDIAGYKADPEDFVLEQCTGAKDVDGNFIYEGDLLEVDIGCGKIQIVAIWAETKFKFEKFGFNSLYLYDFEDTCLNSKKIIGNIHENKGEHNG